MWIWKKKKQNLCNNSHRACKRPVRRECDTKKRRRKRWAEREKRSFGVVSSRKKVKYSVRMVQLVDVGKKKGNRGCEMNGERMKAQGGGRGMKKKGKNVFGQERERARGTWFRGRERTSSKARQDKTEKTN